MFDETKHKRDKAGRFTDKNGESYSDGVNERIRWAKENDVNLPLSADGSLDDVALQYLQEKREQKNNALSDFVERVKSGKAKAGETFELGEITDRARKDIERLTGQKLNATKHVISADSVRHITKRHGESGESDRSMSTIEDFNKISDVLKNYDTVEISKDKDGEPRLSSAYKTRDNALAPHLLYKKAIDNDQMEVVEAVTDTKKGNLYILTAYKKSRKE